MIHWNQLSVQVDEDDRLIVDGVTLPVDVIPELLYSLAHPDPRKWYRFERIGDAVKVHIKIQEVSYADARTMGSNRSSTKQGR